MADEEAEKPDIPIPRAPAGLQARGKNLWRDLHAVYDFAEAPEKLAILEEACRTADVTNPDFSCNVGVAGC